MKQPIRPARQIPASTPITEPVDRGPSVWGGRVLQMPPSETTTDLVQAIDHVDGAASHPGATLDLTNAVYYTTTEGTVSILCRADGFMAARGETPAEGWHWVHGIADDLIATR